MMCGTGSKTTAIRPSRDPYTFLQPVASLLERRISPVTTVLGWFAATAVFVALVLFLGGPSQGDTYESVFATWAIQHGQFACAFPSGFKSIAPLYPLLSGGIAALERIGHAAPFPYESVRGPHCDGAYLAMNSWSAPAHAIDATVRIGLLGWIALMGGVIACVHAFGRGYRLWEPVTLVVLALLFPVWMCVERTFHPQDLFAMGFGLCAVASAKWGNWVAAGLLVALAILFQQFALLIAIPLLFVASSRRQRISYLSTAAITLFVVLAPMVVAGSSGALHAAIFGTGDTGGIGGSVLWELHPHGALLLLLSRLVPLVLSASLAVWARARLPHDSLLEPAPLCSLVAVSLSLRLVFEQQFWGYYYMALAVMLVLFCAAEGRIRLSIFTWLAALSVAYDEPIPSGREDIFTLGFAFLVIVLLGIRAVQEGPRWSDLLWAGLLVTSLVTFSPLGVVEQAPTWFLQILFVPTGMALAGIPLWNRVRANAPKTSVRAAT